MKISPPAVLCSVLLLSGCQNMLKTMVAHVNIDRSQTAFIARGNAYANFCLSKNLINRSTAFDFSLAAADYLDLVVFDNDFYKSVYENDLRQSNEANDARPDQTAAACSTFESRLPKVTADIRTASAKFAQQLHVARAQENYQLAQQMANFRLPPTSIAPMQTSQMPFPNRRYSSEASPAQNLLINTKSGLVQCRVTNNGYVFCI